MQTAAPTGLLFATGKFALITSVTSDEAFRQWGWRIPFLFSFVLVGVGYWIRRNLAESPIFDEVHQQHTEVKAPLVQVLKHYKKELLIAVGARIGSDIAFYVFALFILVYATQELGLSRSLALTGSTLAAVAQMIALPLCGGLADRYGRRPVMITGAALGIIYSFVFFALLDTRNAFLVVTAPAIGLAIVAIMYAPIASFIPELFGTHVRYTGSAVGFQLACVFCGGFAPLIAAALIGRYHNSYVVAAYLSATLALIIVSVSLAKETSKIDLHEVADVAEPQSA